MVLPCPKIRRGCLLACSSLLLLGCVQGLDSGDADPVRVSEGLLSGVPGNDSSVQVFKGIPYGAAPAGNRRWRPPEPPQMWAGVRKADRFAPVCSQVPREPGSFYQIEFVPQPHPTSEDCLYLNIWTRSTSSRSERRPVMVWLHAGGFVWGSGADAVVDGEALARQGVVLVTLNYRLGSLGFLAHPELSAESGRHASGNYGLHDQLAALRWIQQNIAAFGGDPDNVTVFGLSAGAISAQVLMASPLAKGLFHRVIAQSGSVRAMRTQAQLADAERAGLDFGKAVRAPTIQALREVPAEQLLAIPLRAEPTIDGWLLPQDVDKVFEAGQQNDVPVITGGTTKEGSAMPGRTMTVAGLRQWAHQLYGERSEEFLALYPHRTDAQAWDAMVDSLSDRINWGARVWARLQAKAGSSPVYVYEFDRAPPGRDSSFYGAYHMSDIAYVFDNLWAIHRPWSEVDKRLARTMSSTWVRFALAGDPNGPGLPLWPRYDAAREQVMVFDERTELREGARNPDALRFLDRSAK